jgi:hypothetical protein
VGVTAAAIGPRVTSASDKPAAEAFAYTPPDGFVPAGEDVSHTLEGAVHGAERAWVKPTPPSLLGAPKYRPNVSLVRSPKIAPVDEAELVALAAGMPQVYAGSGTTWKEVRHATHVRPDGARVGVIEGAAQKGRLEYRSLQIAFPENEGLSIVTASFPESEAATWDDAFEKSIDAARGVAFRAPPPAPWAYAAWGVGAAVLAFLAMGLRVGKRATARALT